MTKSVDALDVPCDCCGLSSRESHRLISITFTRGGEEQTILCELCERLIKEGMLRPETLDGELRYRQWHFQPMTPGDLLPKRAK